MGTLWGFRHNGYSAENSEALFIRSDNRHFMNYCRQIHNRTTIVYRIEGYSPTMFYAQCGGVVFCSPFREAADFPCSPPRAKIFARLCPCGMLPCGNDLDNTQPYGGTIMVAPGMQARQSEGNTTREEKISRCTLGSSPTAVAQWGDYDFLQARRRPMQQTPWNHARRDLPSPEEIFPAPSEHAPVHPLRQDSAMGSSETYYVYHLGREVQQHHCRLFATYCFGQVKTDTQ
jgi:hypothetical protein